MFLQLAVILGCPGTIPVRGIEKVNQPKINTDRRQVLLKLRRNCFRVHGEAGKLLAALFFDRKRLDQGIPRDIPVQHKLDFSHFGDLFIHIPLFFKRTGLKLRVTYVCPLSPFLESGKAGFLFPVFHPAEKMLKGTVQTLQNILQNLGMYSLELRPVLLEFWQGVLLHIICYAFSMVIIRINPLL